MTRAGSGATRTPRGRDVATERLLLAAMDLLAEEGPRHLTVRAVAKRAGVNHGLIHHYFGGKDGLLLEAMRRLVREHHDYARSHMMDDDVPEPLMLAGDQRYLRALVRCVLDGADDLVRVEFDEDLSVPRRAARRAVASAGETPATKARVMLAVAAEMGWVALEPFLFMVADVSAADADEVRREAQQVRRSQHARIAAAAD